MEAADGIGPTVELKAHRVEVGKRMREIRLEFKNNRDKVIDGNKPGE